jgi:hypothetical protein
MPAESWPSAENAASVTSPAAVSAAPGAADYDTILAAVMETERGRWFLAEYARRNRHADTAEVLAALERLTARSGGRPFVSQAEIGPREAGANDARLRGELADMATTIARTKAEIAAILLEPARGDRTVDAAEPFDAVVRTTERATTEILAAAKQVQDVAWTMREQGMEQAFCNRLDRYATQICAACASQDPTGQRTRKIIHVLRYVEARIQAMRGLWDAAENATEVTTEGAPQVATEATPAAVAPAPEQAIESGDLVESEADRATEPALPVSDVTPAASANEEKPTTHTIEGPTGSFSILTGRTAEPEEAPATPAPAAAVPSVEPEVVVDDLRVLAAQLVAEFGNDADAPNAEPHAMAKAAPAPTTRPEIAPAAEAPREAAPSVELKPATEPKPVVEPPPMVEPEPIIANLRAFAASFAVVAIPEAAPAPTELREIAAATKAPPLAAPSAAVVEQPPIVTDKTALPLTAAPQLGDLPQHPAPEPQPSPRRKADIAEDLFADVMVLTEEERIALFT